MPSRNSNFHSFTSIPVWIASKDIALKIYTITNQFPKSEQFGLSSQLRRAVTSISANIAEGFYRNTTKELINFLYIARGSAGECINFIIISQELAFITRDQCESFTSSFEEIIFQLNKWVKSLRNIE